MDLDVRRLRILREVAVRGTITAAAESLGFTPSAISQQLSSLERESGTALLERVGRRVRLTDAGQVLVGHTEPVLAALEEARAALEKSRDAITGELRVAASGSVARALVIPVAAAITAARPRLHVTVLEHETGDGLRELRLGRLDVVVAHEYSGDHRSLEPAVTRVALFSEDMFIAAPVGRLTAPVDLARLAGEVWAAEPAGSTCGRATRAACRAAGFEPDVRYVSSEPAVVLSAVRCAGAVALLPGLGLAQPPQGIDALPVAGAGVQRLVFAAHRRGSANRPGIALILARLKAAARELSRPAAAAGWQARNTRPSMILALACRLTLRAQQPGHRVRRHPVALGQFHGGMAAPALPAHRSRQRLASLQRSATARDTVPSRTPTAPVSTATSPTTAGSADGPRSPRSPSSVRPGVAQAARVRDPR